MKAPSLRPSLLLTTMCVSACWAAPSWTPTRFSAPEVQDHEERSDDGNADAMTDVGAEKRVGVDDGAAQQAETHIVVRSNEGRSEGAFIAEPRGSARHV